MRKVTMFPVGAAALIFAGLVLGMRPASAQEQVGFKFPSIIAEYNVQLPMRDGVKLTAVVYRPKDNARHPAVFSQTPYGREVDRYATATTAAKFVGRGYAVIVVDVRGRYDSEGQFRPFHDARDGSEVLDWIARQPWSNGKAVTIGGSYTGNSQWSLWRERNEHHAAIVSYVTPADGFGDLVRFNGVPKLDLMFTWMMSYGYARTNHVAELEDFDWQLVMRQLPLHTLDVRVGRRFEPWELAMRHDKLDEYWAPLQVMGNPPGRDIPTLNVGGWYDGQLLGEVRNYRKAVESSASAAEHKLIIGPWLHAVNQHRKVGELDAGPEAIIDLDQLRDGWMDHVMLGKAPPVFGNVVYFLPIKNEWREASAFPLPGTRFTAFHFSSGGRANTAEGDGVLGSVSKGPADRFTYDPASPVPSLSSRTAGARSGLPQGSVDHRAIEKRPDILVYTSAPLAEDMEITGPVSATIYMSTTVVDTDIVVRLMDVYPDGRSLNLAEGIARAKYRNSLSAPELLTPGTVYKIPVELFPTSTYFRQGHRIRVQVTSSDFPVFARNLNTANSDSGTQMAIAHTQIHHTKRYRSSILLPVVPRGASTAFHPPLKQADAQTK